MKFNLGEHRRIYGGPKYIKDTIQVQVDPPQVEEQKEEPQIEIHMSGEPSLQPIIDEIKEETNGSIQSEQVDEGQSVKQTPKRKPSQRARKSNS